MYPDDLFPLSWRPTGADSESDSNKRRGERGAWADPVLAALAAGMKGKMNPSFPNSQTIPKLEQNCNHHGL